MTSSESQGNFCCYPHKRHRKPVYKNLRKITGSNSSLAASSYWCDNCRKYVVSVDAGAKVRGGGHQDERNMKDILQALGSKEENRAKSNLCCDPHKRHKKAITKNVRKFTAHDAETDTDLIVGLYWCDSCREYVITDPEPRGLTGKRDLNGKCKVVERDGECCNPFKIHSSAIHKGLREIKEPDKERYPALTVGLFLCGTCRKIIPDNTDSQDMAEKMCPS